MSDSRRKGYFVFKEGNTVYREAGQRGDGIREHATVTLNPDSPDSYTIARLLLHIQEKYHVSSTQRAYKTALLLLAEKEFSEDDNVSHEVVAASTTEETHIKQTLPRGAQLATNMVSKPSKKPATCSTPNSNLPSFAEGIDPEDLSVYGMDNVVFNTEAMALEDL